MFFLPLLSSLSVSPEYLITNSFSFNSTSLSNSYRSKMFHMLLWLLCQ